MALVDLAPVRDVWDAPAFAGPDHPMRKVTRGVAFEDKWGSERAGKVGALFDSMAPEWGSNHEAPGRYWGIEDAIERGGPDGGELTASTVVELGSGTGLGTTVLADRFDNVFAFDLALDMLRHAPPELAPRTRADASRLPLADDTADLVVMVNMLLFPAEVDRVLAPGGSVLWTNTLGDQTPIHLPAADVLAALPGAWSGVSSVAASATWLVARRD